MLAVERLVGVRVEKAETALVDRNIVPDVVKIDIQGGELEALKGFGSLLDKVVCVELEVSLMSIYEGQPLFGEIFDFMTDKGFGLFDVQVFGVAGPRNAIQSNAFFCRREMTGPRQKAIEYIFRCTNDFILRP